MAGSLWFRDAKKQGFEEGIAQQKAKDEKRLAQKDALILSKDAEIAKLKEQLAKSQKK